MRNQNVSFDDYLKKPYDKNDESTELFFQENQKYTEKINELITNYCTHDRSKGYKFWMMWKRMKFLTNQLLSNHVKKRILAERDQENFIDNKPSKSIVIFSLICITVLFFYPSLGIATIFICAFMIYCETLAENRSNRIIEYQLDATIINLKSETALSFS